MLDDEHEENGRTGRSVKTGVRDVPLSFLPPRCVPGQLARTRPVLVTKAKAPNIWIMSLLVPPTFSDITSIMRLPAEVLLLIVGRLSPGERQDRLTLCALACSNRLLGALAVAQLYRAVNFRAFAALRARPALAAFVHEVHRNLDRDETITTHPPSFPKR
jgi:hypothetical protein